MKATFDPSLAPVLREVGGAAGRSGARAWAVGGVVRDALLGRATRDVDIAVEGDAVALARALGGAWGIDPEEHDAFQTATLRRSDGLNLDIVRARSESYERPGALPVVAPDSMEADLRRRDFTVNAIAASLAPEGFGDLLDPEGGAEDLANRTLRTLHAGSFEEDPTRLFRAARYAVRLGLSPDVGSDATATAAVEGGALMTVSADRRRREVEIIGEEPCWAEMVAWLNRWGVWEALAGWRPAVSTLRHADVALAWARRNRLEPLPAAGEFRFLYMLATAGGSLDEPLGARPAEARTVERAHRILRALAGPDTPDWRREMDAERLTALLLALTLTGSDGRKRRLTEYLTDVRPVRCRVTGAHLLAAGARSGPAVGAALRDTLDAVRAGLVHGYEEELAFALRVYHEQEARTAERNPC